MIRLLQSVPALALVNVVATAQTPPARAIISGPVAARADSAMQQIASAGFSGVVLVAKDGNVILENGYGLADRTRNIPMSPASIVQIGSNTKDFTIVAMLQLMERGKLHLTDSITKYFPGVPTDKRGITIKHLLDHQAGFAQHMGPDFEVVTRDQELERALTKPLLFAPGTNRQYSNIGYSLLAAIIETVSGKSYDEYVRDNIFTPAGMHETGLVLPQFDRGRLARGYRDGKDQGTFLERPLAADGPHWNLRGNGGMLSTVGDMFRFYRTLFSDGPLLAPASRNRYFHADEPVVLSGSDLTWFFFYSRYPRLGYDIFLVSNATDYPAPRARGLLSAALGIDDGGPGAQRVVTGPGGSGTGRGNNAPDAGSTTLPDSPAGRAAKKFLEMNADMSDSSIRRFLEQDVVKRADDQRTIEQRMTGLRERREETGALQLLTVQSATQGEITFSVRSRSAEVFTVTITIESAAPFRITGIRITD